MVREAAMEPLKDKKEGLIDKLKDSGTFVWAISLVLIFGVVIVEMGAADNIQKLIDKHNNQVFDQIKDMQTKNNALMMWCSKALSNGTFKGTDYQQIYNQLKNGSVANPNVNIPKAKKPPAIDMIPTHG